MAPPLDPLHARVDFLSAPDKTHASTPVSVPPHDFKEETRLGFLTAEFLFALIRIPGTLRLIKHDCMLVRANARRAAQVLLEEIDDVLDSGADDSPFSGQGCWV